MEEENEDEDEDEKEHDELRRLSSTGASASDIPHCSGGQLWNECGGPAIAQVGGAVNRARVIGLDVELDEQRGGRLAVG